VRGKNSDLVQIAWQKAQDAWVAAGKPVPCYDAEYMKAREGLAEVVRKRRGRAAILYLPYPSGTVGGDA
jgi:hypothetical protein